MPPRARVLRLLRPFGRRIVRTRQGTLTLTLALLYALPWLGIARVDLWRGRHMVLGMNATWLVATAAVYLVWLVLVAATFVVNAGLGRVLCGFGCPIGQAFRNADALLGAIAPVQERATEAVFALLVAGSAIAWWVDPQVLVGGSAVARATTLGAWLLAGIVLVVFARKVRWAFCKRWCPIGVFYTAVSTRHRFGIHFSPGDSCGDCGLCDAVCPIGLAPRALGTAFDTGGGIAFEGLAGATHCLVCGDCARACAFWHRKKRDVTPALRLGLGAQAADVPEAPSTTVAMAPEPEPQAPEPQVTRGRSDQRFARAVLGALPVAGVLAWLVSGPPWPHSGARGPGAVGVGSATASVARESNENDQNYRQQVRGKLQWQGEGVQGAVVVVDNAAPLDALTESSAAVIRHGAYDVGLRLVHVGEEVRVHNADAVLHTAQFCTGARCERNVPVPSLTTVPITLEAPGVYSVRCAVHGEERAWWVVVERASAAFTGPRGEFVMDAVPMGVVSFSMWVRQGDRLMRRVQTIEVGREGAIVLDMTGVEAVR